MTSISDLAEVNTTHLCIFGTVFVAFALLVLLEAVFARKKRQYDSASVSNTIHQLTLDHRSSTSNNDFNSNDNDNGSSSHCDRAERIARAWCSIESKENSMDDAPKVESTTLIVHRGATGSAPSQEVLSPTSSGDAAHDFGNRDWADSGVDAVPNHDGNCRGTFVGSDGGGDDAYWGGDDDVLAPETPPCEQLQHHQQHEEPPPVDTAAAVTNSSGSSELPVQQPQHQRNTTEKQKQKQPQTDANSDSGSHIARHDATTTADDAAGVTRGLAERGAAAAATAAAAAAAAAAAPAPRTRRFKLTCDDDKCTRKVR